jgi:hypothetical protein
MNQSCYHLIMAIVLVNMNEFLMADTFWCPVHIASQFCTLSIGLGARF